MACHCRYVRYLHVPIDRLLGYRLLVFWLEKTKRQPRPASSVEDRLLHNKFHLFIQGFQTRRTPKILSSAIINSEIGLTKLWNVGGTRNLDLKKKLELLSSITQPLSKRECSPIKLALWWQWRHILYYATLQPTTLQLIKVPVLQLNQWRSTGRWLIISQDRQRHCMTQ